MATINVTGSGTDLLCVICGVKVYFGEDTTLINSRKEIYFKFTTLLSRYLNLESTKESLNYYNSNYCHVDDTSHKNSVCCFTCHVKVQAFCDTYHRLECFQLKLFHIVGNLSKLMEATTTTSTIHNNFREELISKVQKQKQRHGPFVRLEKLNESELQLLQKSLVSEIEISSELIKSEIQDDEDEECDLGLSDQDDGAYDDIEESTSQFDLEQNFDNFGEKKINLQDTVSDDPKNPIDIGDKYLVKIKFENSSQQKAVSASGKLKSKPRLQEQCLKCLICGKTFLKFNRLCKHIRSHIGESVFHCQTCLKEFTRNQQLTKHKVSQHLNGGVKCDICSKRVENIESHCRIKHRPFTKLFCDRCGHTFNHESTLKRHGTECRIEKIYVCDICGKNFNSPNRFRRHMERIHGNDKPTKNFKCSYFPCEKAFYEKYDLVNHIRTHTGERPFKCDQCGNSFSRRSSLKRHLHSHSTIKNDDSFNSD